MLLANGGARRILVQLAAGVLLAVWTLLGNMGGVCAQPQPTPERWGVRPFAEEERDYQEKVAQIEREIHQVQSRLNQTRNNLEALWADWSVDDKTWAEHQFFANPQRYGGALGGGLSLAKEEWDRAIGTYETVMAGAGRVDLRDPLVGPEVRDQVWSAHLRVLRRQLEYFNTALAYENIRYIAIKEQQQYWFGEWNAFVNDAIDHIEYVYWSHVDAVMTELFNCMAKSTANVARSALLNQWGPYRAYMRVDQPIPDPVYSAPAGTANGWNVIWTTDPVKDRVPLGDAFFLDCIRDGFRAGLVSAVVSGMRKSFVDRVSRRDNVHPQIAEYWWSRFIWDGPIEDPYTHLMLDLGSGSGRPNYVQRKLEDAFWKNWGTGQPYKEQAIEQLKELIGARQSGKLAPVYKEAMDAVTAAYDNAVRRGAIRPQRMAELKRASDKAADDIYKRKAPGIGAKAAVEVAEYVITIGFQAEAAIEILWQEFSFEQQEQVLVKTHNEIFQCLTKMEMSTGPAQIIGIYELGRNGRQGIDDLFRQCREPTRAQRERTMEQLREIDRQISVLLDEATAQSNLARTQCDAALTACSAAARGYTATADSADQQKRARATAESELAALQSRITALDRQAEQAAQDGQAMGQAMVGAEQAALSACEVLKGFPSLKTDAERQGQLAVMRQGATRAGAEQRICRDRGSALRSLTGQIRAEAAAVAAEADAVAAASGPVAGDTASADSDLERCRGSLGAARNAANALPALEQKALQLHSQAEAVARPMRGNKEIEGQMDTLWRHVEPITIAGRGPGECLPRAAQQLAAAEAAQGRAQGALADAGAAPTATSNPAAIKQAAEAAARKAENAGTFADDYLGRADVAAAGARKCVAVAEDLARKASTAAAATGSTSAESTSGSPAAGSGDVELANQSLAELRDLAKRERGELQALKSRYDTASAAVTDNAAGIRLRAARIERLLADLRTAVDANAGSVGSAPQFRQRLDRLAAGVREANALAEACASEADAARALAAHARAVELAAAIIEQAEAPSAASPRPATDIAGLRDSIVADAGAVVAMQRQLEADWNSLPDIQQQFDARRASLLSRIERVRAALPADLTPRQRELLDELARDTRELRLAPRPTDASESPAAIQKLAGAAVQARLDAQDLASRAAATDAGERPGAAEAASARSLLAAADGVPARVQDCRARLAGAAAGAAPREPARPSSSGFQMGATQAGPADRPAVTRGDAGSPAVEAPGAATRQIAPADGGFAFGPTITGSGAPRAGEPATRPDAPADGGFAFGPASASRDPAQPLPAGSAPAGGGQGAQPAASTPATSAPMVSPPVALQTRAVAGQPAAFHIFATGSRMGWAAGLGQYSVGPADATIVEHLQVAGEHLMWANRESYLPVKAWPNWTANRAELRSWADELVRDPRNPTRRQITLRANSRAATLADELRYQTVGSPQYTATCDAAYMRLGYELGYGQQVLGIADEAARNGDRALAQKARQDGASHLQNATRILAEYERTLHVTGRCADLRDVGTRLDAIFRLDGGDFASQSRAATDAWQLALERIAALRLAQPAPVPPPAPALPSPSAPPAAQGPPSTRARTADPQELEGVWFECLRRSSAQQGDRPDDVPRIARCVDEGMRDRSSGLKRGGLAVEFTKRGDRYVGKEAGDSAIPWSLRDAFWGRAFSYRPASEVFRLTRTAQGTYEGEVFDCPGCIPGDRNEGKWVATRIVVDGDVAREYYERTRTLIYWVREPRRHPPANR
jgi:hypothetical protein